jgi:YHS domain-containing protein
MLRNLLILILITVGLALVRWLVKDVVRAVSQALGLSGSSPAEANKEKSAPGSGTVTGHMVRDPVSGTYIDEKLAIREVVNGETLYFESRETRDAYLKKARS